MNQRAIGLCPKQIESGTRKKKEDQKGERRTSARGAEENGRDRTATEKKEPCRCRLNRFNKAS